MCAPVAASYSSKSVMRVGLAATIEASPCRTGCGVCSAVGNRGVCACSCGVCGDCGVDGVFGCGDDGVLLDSSSFDSVRRRMACERGDAGESKLFVSMPSASEAAATSEPAREVFQLQELVAGEELLAEEMTAYKSFLVHATAMLSAAAPTCAVCTALC